MEKEFSDLVISHLDQNKAEEIVCYDLRGQSSVSDFIIISTGRSQAHVKGIAEKLQYELKQIGHPVRGVEGLSEGSWVLMDYNDVIVHIFHPETRQYYQLEQIYQQYPNQAYALAE